MASHLAGRKPVCIVLEEHAEDFLRAQVKNPRRLGEYVSYLLHREAARQEYAYAAERQAALDAVLTEKNNALFGKP